MANVAFCGLRVDPVLLHVVDHLLDQRTRRSDRIPGDDRASPEHGPQAGGGVAVDNDFALSLVHPLDAKRVGLHEIRARVVDAGLHRLDIGLGGLDLRLELLSNRLLHFHHIDSQQFCHDPYINHVGQQFSQLDVGDHLAGQLCEGNAIVADVAAHALQAQRLFCQEGPTRLHGHGIFARRLGVHRDHEVNFSLARDVPVFIGADGEPGRQTRNIRREEILAAHRHAHLKDGTHQDIVGGLASGSVDSGDLNAEIIHDRFSRARALDFSNNRRF